MHYFLAQKNRFKNIMDLWDLYNNSISFLPICFYSTTVVTGKKGNKSEKK